MPVEFLDTNVLVYAFTTDRRAAAASALLAQRCVISVQILNEFANVARRKLGMTWQEVRESVDSITTLCPTVLPVEMKTHRAGVRIAEQHGYNFFDALVIAAALEANAKILWSEDMHHGMIIDDRLVISNPFLAT
jgi:predicted nucleic acid-binding protein